MWRTCRNSPRHDGETACTDTRPTVSGVTPSEHPGARSMTVYIKNKANFESMHFVQISNALFGVLKHLECILPALFTNFKCSILWIFINFECILPALLQISCVFFLHVLQIPNSLFLEFLQISCVFFLHVLQIPNSLFLEFLQISCVFFLRCLQISNALLLEFFTNF